MCQHYHDFFIVEWSIFVAFVVYGKIINFCNIFSLYTYIKATSFLVCFYKNNFSLGQNLFT